MPFHIFTGSVTRVPVKYGAIAGWYHVDCYADSRTPVAVAVMEETLLAGGGTRIYPGGGASINGAGVWVCGPLNGMVPIVSIEQRTNPTYLSVDPRAQLGVIASEKVHRMALTPNVWRSFSTGIIGMTSWKLRAFGGVVWFGTHLDVSQPPTIENPTMGDAAPLFPGDPWYEGVGNGDYYAWTFDPGVQLFMVKRCGGYDFVQRPT